MISPSLLGLFVLSSLALLLTPGPAVLYVVSRSVHQGRRAGLVSVLGLSLGGSLHVAAAALGLSALLLSSSSAFAALRYAGAAYLVYLGLRTLLRPSPEPASGGAAAAPAQSARHIFLEGVLVNVLNPKAALFFLAFLPQFVVLGGGSEQAQLFLLGGLFLALGLLTDTAYALAASSAGRLVRGSSAARRLGRYAAASVYLGLGIATALSGSRTRQ